MTRIPFVCGNWKMNITPSQAGPLARAVAEGLPAESEVEVAVAPTAAALAAVASALGDRSRVQLAAQNVHPAESGAYTGEVSVAMLADLGVRYVILGHSERRSLFGETDTWVGEKLGAVLAGGLRPILCVGESLEERDGNDTLTVVERQLRAGLAAVADDGAGLDRVVVAYEPVWAIGTGRTATPDQAQEVHGFLRRLLREQWGDAGAAVRIQYGGSVKPGNAAELFAQPDIDGGLIGGASLKAPDFLAIVQAAAQAG